MLQGKGQVFMCVFLKNIAFFRKNHKKYVDSHKARCYNEIIKIRKTITTLKYIGNFSYELSYTLQLAN